MCALCKYIHMYTIIFRLAGCVAVCYLITECACIQTLAEQCLHLCIHTCYLHLCFLHCWRAPVALALALMSFNLLSVLGRIGKAGRHYSCSPFKYQANATVTSFPIIYSGYLIYMWWRPLTILVLALLRSAQTWTLSVLLDNGTLPLTWIFPCRTLCICS